MAGKLGTILSSIGATTVRAAGGVRRGVPPAARATAAFLRRPGARFGTQVGVTAVLLAALVLLAAYVVPHAGSARPTAAQSADPNASDAPIALPPGAAAIPGAPGVPPPTTRPNPTGTPVPGTTTAGPSGTLAGWATKLAAKVGISARALQAYGFAEVQLAIAQPNCHLSWTTLAGIGSVESGHGTTGGTSLAADGKPVKPIRGPVLDGSAGNKAIPDTDQGKWDGDTKWDRAVGPMQFIPSTWANLATDADGDGKADPNDIDDAALAAGKHLCGSGRDLATGTGWYQAVFGYNRLDSYVITVYKRADDYGRLSAGA